jgi:hypothetical protein
MWKDTFKFLCEQNHLAWVVSAPLLDFAKSIGIFKLRILFGQKFAGQVDHGFRLKGM